MQSLRPVRGAFALLIALVPLHAWGQRMQFATPVEATSPSGLVPVTPAPTSATVSPTVAYPAAAAVAPSSPAYGAAAAAPVAAAPVQVAAPAVGAAAPAAVPIAPPTTAPVYGPGVSSGPTSMFQGAVQPPPTTWDPYATPGSQSPALFPQDPFTTPTGAPPGQEASVTRFFQHFHLRDYWIPGNASNELGLNDMEVAGSFAFPFLYNDQSPLLVTPGFGVQAWSGPKTSAATNFADLPPATYDAFLEFGWNPQVTPWFGGELAIRTGVYSDFSSVTTNSIRFTGRGVMVLTFSPTLQLVGGIEYLDRVRIKLLPVVGIVWKPNADVRFDINFPEPRLSTRLTTVGNTEWWWYVRGEYGGGSWTIQRISGNSDQFDYNDIRAALGLEWKGLRGWGGFFEVGGAFSREIVYRSTHAAAFKPDPMVFLGAGITF